MSYTRDELLKFFHAVDEELVSPSELILIGGASLTLAYNFTNTTVDIDTIEFITMEVTKAIEVARLKTKIDIKVSTTKVFAEISGMRGRFTIFEENNYKHLKIYIPEKHDLALLKCWRYQPRDVRDIINLHVSDPLDSNLLLDRFIRELLPFDPGDEQSTIDKYLAMIEELFGEEMAKQHEGKLN